MKISFTKTADKRALEIQHYLNEEFGLNAKKKFQNDLLSFLNVLSKFPKIGTLEVSEKNI